MAEAITRPEFEQHQREVDRRFGEVNARIGGVKSSHDEDVVELKATDDEHGMLIQELRDSSKYIAGALSAIKLMMAILLGIVGVASSIAAIYAVFK